MGRGVDGVADYTQEQWDTLKTLIEGLQRKYPEARVVGHNEVSGRTSVKCPGWDVKKWIQMADTQLISKDPHAHPETASPQTPPVS